MITRMKGCIKVYSILLKRWLVFLSTILWVKYNGDIVNGNCFCFLVHNDDIIIYCDTNGSNTCCLFLVHQSILDTGSFHTISERWRRHN